jgi:uncharacterized integral membrane protein (TIGR00698 family)
MSAATVSAGIRERAVTLAPGVMMAFTVAAASSFLSEHYGAPVMLFALLIGMAFHFLSQEGRCVEGVSFTASVLLKIGVALLGVRVSFSQLASLGLAPALIVPTLVAGTVLAGVLMSRMFGRGVKFGVLTGGAVAICGASAALAISSALPRSASSERDTLFTVIAVTTLSTVAMIVYPLIFSAFGFDDQEIGFLIGATIHDVAQVVGAGYSVSDSAGDVATYVKMMRVAMLPILVVAIAFIARSGESDMKSSFPWFAVAFAALLVVNSTGIIPQVIVAAMTEASRWLLIAAIAALGMKTSLKAMVDLGGGHIGVVVASTLLLLAAAMGVVFIL